VFAKRTALLLLAAGCGSTPQKTVPAPAIIAEQPHDEPPPTPPPPSDDAKIAEAKQFVADADRDLRRVMVAAAEAEWTQETDETDAHEAAAAKANGEQAVAITRLMKQARTYEPVMGKLDPLTRRQLEVLIYMLPVAAAVQPAPEDGKQAEELAKIAEEMTSLYGKGKVCDDKNKCKDLDALSKILQKSRKPDELLAAWKGWHDTVGHGERDLFAKYVPLANAGAKAVGFSDVSELWKAGYDMPADAFADDTDRLWEQVKPLYTQLHCYARRKLNGLYGDKLVSKTGPIPAHLLGNMWAQSWGYLYPELEPYKGVAKIDVTPALEKSYDATKMMKMGEAFYTSLGMDPLPETFWQRSMLTKPPGKDVVCHASSWDVRFDNDLRIKMCTNPTQEDLITIHHELGHSYYFHNYYKLPIVLQNGANDGFHEAIGDTIALSMTPDYLAKKGLLAKPDVNDKATINHQMRVALDKIAFLPFGLLVDRWRWDVFAGKVAPDQYNAHWWELRAKYQGVAPPVPRGPDDFDPGAKFHVASNTPYMRYFLAAVLQFQFHRALCQKAGFTGPLHECSIYDNKDAGAAFQKMLALGASQPWQDALYELTGQRVMDARAILEYFEPLQHWLEEQNKGQACGW
jgi:peptidyl-dipeptidase A